MSQGLDRCKSIQREPVCPLEIGDILTARKLILIGPIESLVKILMPVRASVKSMDLTDALTGMSILTSDSMGPIKINFRAVRMSPISNGQTGSL